MKKLFKKCCDTIVKLFKKCRDVIVKLYKKYREIIVYIIVGLMTTAVSYGIRLGVIYGFSPILGIDLADEGGRAAILRTVAVTVGWVAGVVFAFIPNKKWVFRNNEGGKTVWAQFIKFVASRVGTYFVELALAVLLPMGLIACGYKSFHFILEIDADMLSMGISMVLVTVLNYVLSKLLIFKKSKKGDEGKENE